MTPQDGQTIKAAHINGRPEATHFPKGTLLKAPQSK